jgi:hypothetical protein
VLVALGGIALATGKPPAVPSITSTPESPTVATSATFAFTGKPSGGRLECKLDSGSFATCTSPKTYGGLASGQHTFQIRAVSSSGASAAAAHTWTIVPPVPAPVITGKPANPSTNDSATFTFSATQPGAAFRCALDGGPFAGCSSPKTYAGPLAAGSHAFAVRTVSGPLESAATAYTWTIKAPPAPAITLKPPALTNAATATFGFSSTQAGVSFECRLDTGSYTACTSPAGYLGPLGEGPHLFQVRARSGSLVGPAASHLWVVDTTPPPAPLIVLGPGSPWASTNALFGFLDAEPAVQTLCRLDAGSHRPCLLVQAYSNLSQGTHSFSVLARDAAGNVSGATTWSWVVDTVPPPAPVITQKPTDPSPSATVTFAWTDSEPGVAFQCAVDSDDWRPCTSPSTFTVDGDDNRRHRFSVRAVDGAGNRSGAVSSTWKVAASAGFTISGDADGLLYPGLWRTISVTVSNPSSFAIEVTSLTVSATGASSGCPAGANLELEQASIDGSHRLTVPPHGSVTLPAQGRNAPRIRIRNLPSNQDACKGSSFTLAYAGTATK